MMIPPRSPNSRPLWRASSSRGRIPAENRMISVSSSAPSPNFMTWLAFAPSSIDDVAFWVCTFTPRSSILERNTRPPRSSICTAIRRGANSTTWVSRFRSRRAFAASSPSKPPPITTPVFAFRLAARMASRSSMVR